MTPAFRTSPDPYTLAAIESRSIGFVKQSGNGFVQGRRRVRTLWQHIWPVALTLAIFTVLIIVSMALNVTV